MYPQVRQIRPTLPAVGGGMPMNPQPQMPQQMQPQPQQQFGNASMTGTAPTPFQNPMQNPLAMLAAAKMEHAGMIIKGLLKHLDKGSVDVNDPANRR